MDSMNELHFIGFENIMYHQTSKAPWRRTTYMKGSSEIHESRNTKLYEYRKYKIDMTLTFKKNKYRGTRRYCHNKKRGLTKIDDGFDFFLI